MATEEGPPLRQGARMGLDWFSVTTETSGGITPDLGFFMEVLGKDLMDYGTRIGKILSLGMPKAPQVKIQGQPKA